VTLTPLGETLLNIFLIGVLYVGLGTFFTLISLVMIGAWPKPRKRKPPKPLTHTTEASDDQ
jgi:hypothetical protein